MIAVGQGTPPLGYSGRTCASAATAPRPPPHSGARTQGGVPPRPGVYIQQTADNNSSSSHDRFHGSKDEVPPIFLRDLRGLPGAKVRKLRFVDVHVWFPDQREDKVDPRFFTLLQEAFYYAYVKIGVCFSEHHLLH